MRSSRTSACFRAQSRDVLYYPPMAQTDLERFTRIMLDEFGRVHERLDRHDDRFDNIEAETAQHSCGGCKSIRTELDDLSKKLKTSSAIAKRSTAHLSASAQSRSTSASTEKCLP